MKTVFSEGEIKHHVVFSEGEIKHHVRLLAERVKKIFSGDFDVIGILDGAFMLTADLVRYLDRLGLDFRVGFVRASSYQNGTSPAHKPVIKHLSLDVYGREVLLVDDLVDSGVTMDLVVSFLKERGAKRVVTCVLIRKVTSKTAPDIWAVNAPEDYLVGYGAGLGARYRSKPYVTTLNNLSPSQGGSDSKRKELSSRSPLFG